MDLKVILITALVSSILVGVFGKRIAESLLEILLWPIKRSYSLIYSWIAPRNPFSISLRTYRRHLLRSNLTKMENPIGPSLDVPLEQAFAPLKVRSSSTQDSIELFSYVATNTRCVVLGGPGTGKTTLMKSLVTSVTQKRCHQNLNDLIPVFVVLRNLAKMQQSVQQAIVSALADHHFPGAGHFVESSLNAGKMLIVLDGLDEVGASRHFVVEQILRFCHFDSQREVPNKLLVTCREHSYRIRDLRDAISEILQVEPFTNHHMRVFLQGWPSHKGRTAISLYNLIQQDPQIRDICRNPLLLTILTGLYLDTERFEIPSSRDLFYQSAIDELLFRRPARRQIIQQFDGNDKRQILERVALARLETVAPNEDPEELTQDAIREKAEEVFRREKFDFNALINELVEINGIIKPATDNSFTCAHRTIQEYFAAREALRSRETQRIVTSFGERSELVEVLYFYCALLRNLPALASIVESFVAKSQWPEAGRSLLFMTEAPSIQIVQGVASHFYDVVVSGKDIESSVEILASLASRRGPEFASARQLFADAIDRLAASSESGASALESAIATSPEVALRIIPSLLKNNSERWKAAGVQLLRDIGVDEALDQLVLLLYSEDTYVRRRAGLTLAEMIKSRNQTLRRKVTLLPHRTDKLLWPLEPYFPGTIAIPIIEAVAPSDDSASRAINEGIRAFNTIKEQRSDGRLRKWKRVSFDATLWGIRSSVARLLSVAGLVEGATTVLILFALVSYSFLEKKMVLFGTSVPHLLVVEVRSIDDVSEKARIVRKRIEDAYPTSVSGWARVLPWNWAVSPNIPASTNESFQNLKGWSQGLIDPFDVKKNAEDVLNLAPLVSPDLARELSAALSLLQSEMPSLDGKSYVSFDAHDLPKALSLILTCAMLAFFWIFAMRSATPRGRLKRDWAIERVGTILISVCLILLLDLLTANVRGPRFITLTFTFVSLVTFGLGMVMQILEWPNNPFLRYIREVDAGAQ